jgi:hypothetical protein
MPYLNLDLDYFSHPKTKRLIGLLGRGAEVLPLKLWSYCGKFHAEDGRLTGYTVQEIESIAEWWGKPGESVKALVRVGYLHEEGDAYSVHEWAEHEGHIVAFKERAKTGAKARWDKLKPECLTDATSIANDEPKQCPLPTTPSVPTKPRGKPPNPLPPLPAELDTEEFRPVFERWRKHREEIRKPLKPTMAEAQYRKFVAWGIPYSIAVIEHTISGGWWGFVEPQGPRSGSNGAAETPQQYAARLTRTGS